MVGRSRSRRRDGNEDGNGTRESRCRPEEVKTPTRHIDTCACTRVVISWLLIHRSTISYRLQREEVCKLQHPGAPGYHRTSGPQDLRTSGLGSAAAAAQRSGIRDGGTYHTAMKFMFRPVPTLTYSRSPPHCRIKTTDNEPHLVRVSFRTGSPGT